MLTFHPFHLTHSQEFHPKINDLEIPYLKYIFLYTTPIELMKGKVEIGYIAGVQIFGRLGGKIMSIGISIMLLSTLSSYIYIGPRIMQAMGEDHRMLRN